MTWHQQYIIPFHDVVNLEDKRSPCRTTITWRGIHAYCQINWENTRTRRLKLFQNLLFVTYMKAWYECDVLLRRVADWRSICTIGSDHSQNSAGTGLDCCQIFYSVLGTQHRGWVGGESPGTGYGSRTSNQRDEVLWLSQWSRRNGLD